MSFALSGAMRIVVLSRNAALYSTSRLVLAGRARGHVVDVIDPLDLELVVAAQAPALSYRGHPLPHYDAVIPRIGVRNRYGLNVVRLFESCADVLNPSENIALCRDKVRSLGILAEAGVVVPRSVCLRTPSGVDEALRRVGGCPVIVKLQQGTHGLGTILAESPRGLSSIVDTLQAMGQEVIMQEFIRGREHRALVVGGKIVSVMSRTPAQGEFRSNLHRGGKAKRRTLPRRYLDCARRAARLMGLDIAGVDMMETPRGPVVLEVNSSPGLEGIESATATDVAQAIIAHAEARRARRTRRRKRAVWS